MGKLHFQIKVKILCFLLFFSVSSVFAQLNSEWKPIGLTVDGRNIQNGVEVFYQLNKCNNEIVVFIKFVNHNTYDVIAEWNEAVFTKKLEWISNQKDDFRKSLTIEGDKIVAGDCSGKGQKELIVNVSDFIKNIDDFNLFKITSVKVTSLTK